MTGKRIRADDNRAVGDLGLAAEVAARAGQRNTPAAVLREDSRRLPCTRLLISSANAAGEVVETALEAITVLVCGQRMVPPPEIPPKSSPLPQESSQVAPAATVTTVELPKASVSVSET